MRRSVRCRNPNTFGWCAARKWPRTWVTCTQNAAHNGDNNAERILISCQISYHRHNDIYIQIACESVGNSSSVPDFWGKMYQLNYILVMRGSRQPIDPKLFSIWIITIQFPPLPCRTRGRSRIHPHLLNVWMSNTLSHSVCVKPNTQSRQIFIDVDNSTSVAATKKRLSHLPPVSSSIILGHDEKWVLLVNRIQNNWEYAAKLAEAFESMEDGASVDIVNDQVIPFPI